MSTQPFHLPLNFRSMRCFLTTILEPMILLPLKGFIQVPYQTIYIDDITIDHPPTCPKPNELYADNTTPTTAMLNWTENGDATLWNIEYGYAGFTPTGVPTISA